MGWLAAGLLTGLLVLPASAATTRPEGPPRDPLATKQQIIRDRMSQLEDRMFRLSEKLNETEPQQARRLEGALRQARELLIRRNMEQAMTLLEAGRFAEAADQENAIVRDLERILKVLLEDADQSAERREEMERLREAREQVRQLLEAERRLKAEADSAPRLQQMLAAIRSALARLEGLIARQEQEIAATAKAQERSDAAAPTERRDAQRQLRTETESLRDALQQAGDVPQTGSQAQGSQAPATQPHAGTTKPAGDPTQKEPGESSQAPGESAENRAQGQMQQAERSMGAAAREMQGAEQQLEQNAPKEATERQKKALHELKKAMEQLREQEDATRKRLDQAEAARKQRELGRKTRQLGQQMQGGEQQQAGGEQQDPQQGGQQQDSQQGNQQQNGQKPQQGKRNQQQQQQQPTPGGENVQRASKHMEDAADDLKADKPDEASPKQQRAIDELEQAERQLEEALEQQRKEQQEEILRGLEARFRAILAQQLVINKGTEELAGKPRESWVHADDLAAAALSRDETKTAEDSGQALHILKEDGTSIIFPKIVAQMQEDMQEVARLLSDRQTGEPTRRLQAEIVRTLQELLESIEQLRRELQESQGGGASGGGQAGNEPLLPDSAELKLLRSCQERVNRQTLDLARRLQEGSEGGTLRQAIVKLADRQREVAEMAREMNERVTGQ